MTQKKSRSRFILKLRGVNAEEILSRYTQTIPKQSIDFESFKVTRAHTNVMHYGEISTMKLLLDSGEPYPEFTNARCKWDHYPFEAHPIGIPIKYHHRDGIHYFTCTGFFCSFNCLKSYIKTHANNPLYGNVVLNFGLLCKLVYGEESIKDANDWDLLDCYNDGGGLNIDEFRKGQVAYRKVHNIKLLPCGEYYETTPRNLAKT